MAYQFDLELGSSHQSVYETQNQGKGDAASEEENGENTKRTSSRLKGEEN